MHTRPRALFARGRSQQTLYCSDDWGWQRVPDCLASALASTSRLLCKAPLPVPLPAPMPPMLDAVGGCCP